MSGRSGCPPCSSPSSSAAEGPSSLMPSLSTSCMPRYAPPRPGRDIMFSSGGIVGAVDLVRPKFWLTWARSGKPRSTWTVQTQWTNYLSELVAAHMAAKGLATSSVECGTFRYIAVPSAPSPAFWTLLTGVVGLTAARAKITINSMPITGVQVPRHHMRSVGRLSSRRLAPWWGRHV